MRKTLLPFILLFLLCNGPALFAVAIDDTRQQLSENQRNILHLRKEKQQFMIELRAAQLTLGKPDSNYSAADILELREDILLADELIESLAAIISRQRLLLASMEQDSPPTALDIALNKALNSNLPELAKKLANNKAAQKEIARLRAILKEEALLSSHMPTYGDSVSVAEAEPMAEEEFLRLLSLFSGGTADEADDKNIKITGSADRKPYVKEEILSYLGHNQYHMETMVNTGRMTFTVDGRPWQLSIPPEEEGAIYIIIYNLSVEKKPRLVMFNKSLLLE